MKEKDGCEFYEYVKDVALKNGIKNMTALKVAAGMNTRQMNRFKEFGIISTTLITRMCEACLALNKQEMLDKKKECDARLFQQEQETEAAKMEQYYKDMARKTVERAQAAEVDKAKKLEAAQANKAKKAEKEHEANYKAWCKEVNNIIDKKIDDVRLVGVIELMRVELDHIKLGNADIESVNDSLENLEFGYRWLKEHIGGK